MEQVNKVSFITPEGGVYFEAVITFENPGTLTAGMDVTASLTDGDGLPIFPYEQGKTEYSESRKLVVENPAAGIRYFLVKPSDVAIYVEHGAADIGIVGRDILSESGADVYELLDTGLGKCRMCVAGPADFQDDPGRTLRVATKFVNIAKSYYAAQGRDIDIIKLNGSIELAPLLGLSDVIVDIVETGKTLLENGLELRETVVPISARLIANKVSYKFKHEEISRLCREVSALCRGEEEA